MKAGGTKNILNTDDNRLGRDLLGLFSIFLSILIILSLASFDSRDPWLNHVVGGARNVRNKTGLFGAYTAGFLYDIFGAASWVLPVFLSTAGARRILGAAPWPFLRWSGFIALSLCLAVAGAAGDLGDMRFFARDALPPGSGNVASHGGGIVGRMIYVWLLGWLSPTGAFLVWLFALILAMQMLSGLSLSRQARAVLAALRGLIAGLTRALFAWRRIARETRERRQAYTGEGGTALALHDGQSLSPGDAVVSVRDSGREMRPAQDLSQDKLPPLREDIYVSIHNRCRPPIDSVPADRNRPACPLPEGSGYLKCAPGLAGSQPGISLKGEPSNHKGNFDESSVGCGLPSQDDTGCDIYGGGEQRADISGMFASPATVGGRGSDDDDMPPWVHDFENDRLGPPPFGPAPAGGLPEFEGTLRQPAVTDAGTKTSSITLNSPPVVNGEGPFPAVKKESGPDPAGEDELRPAPLFDEAAESAVALRSGENAAGDSPLSGLAGSQPGISLTGEHSDHRGNFDEDGAGPESSGESSADGEERRETPDYDIIFDGSAGLFSGTGEPGKGTGSFEAKTIESGTGPEDRHKPSFLAATDSKADAPVSRPVLNDPEPDRTSFIKPAVPVSRPVLGDSEPALPSPDILEAAASPSGGVQRDVLVQKGKNLMGCLNDFGIQGELAAITPGPVVTMFEIKPAPGVRVARIANLSDDLALALKAVAVRIQAPVPGTDAVGIEIPNEVRETVCLKELLSSSAFAQSQSLLTLALGKDIAGNPVTADLAAMPHLLVAGATGAGKSVGINSIILSILFKAAPDQVKLLLVDPKRVEMAVYADLPHLVHPVVTDMSSAKNALEWAVTEMERRYDAIAGAGVRNITDYNIKVSSWGDSPPPGMENLAHIPFLVLIIDELADLMMVASKEVETSIVRLAQLARAAGIHLILATQRPSVDVVTGLIKANFPCRIAFQVTSKHDSRTILDTVGAEHLLGKGDMLFKPAGGKFRRLHGAFVSDRNVNAAVDYWKARQQPDYTVDFTDRSREDSGFASAGGGAMDINSEPLYNEAVEFVRSQGKASISLIQRKFRIGFNKAARYVEQMETDGIIGPADGSKPRPVIK